MDNFYVTILSPEKLKLEAEFYMVLLPLYEGEVGIMAGHVNYGSLIMPGLLKFFSDEANVKHTMFISGGIVEVLDGKLTILADKIIDLQDLTQGEARIRIKELKDILEDKNLETTVIENLSRELDTYNKILTLRNFN